MILLQVNKVARRFADVTLYEDVSFSIQTRDRVALVGRNGTGKSTLIQQIMHQEPINEGEISITKGVSIGYLEQHVALNSNRTIWEEMISVFDDTIALREQAQKAAEKVAELSTTPDSDEYNEALAYYDQLQEDLSRKNAYSIESDIKSVLHGFRFFEDDFNTPVQELSGGQQTRLAMARILLMDYDLLILDEPTNHLDMDTLAWLEGYLSNYRGALLIVSHDRYFLNRVANQVVELRHHTSHIYKGNYDFYLKEKAQREEQELKAYEKQQDEIHRLEDFVQRNIARASTTKRAQSRRKQLERMTKIEKPLQDQNAPRIQFSVDRSSGERVIEARELAIGYDSTLVPIAEHINFNLRKQEAIAIVGPNGIGKSTLLKTIIKQIPALSGEIDYGSNVQIGYYDQNVNQLNPKLTVLETLWQAHDNMDEWKIRSILGSFLFSGEAVEKNVGLLSGGEKAWLSLALLALDHDNTLLLDEPTNHLDIDSKEVLENALIEFDGTLLFVSHDRYFINRLATSVLELTEEGTTLYLGDYDYYVAKKAELEEIEQLKAQNENDAPTNERTPSSSQLNYEEMKYLRSQARQLTKQIDQAWEENEQWESQIEELEIKMAQAAEENNQGELASLHQDLISAKKASEKSILDWENASLEFEAFLEEHPTLKP